MAKATAFEVPHDLQVSANTPITDLGVRTLTRVQTIPVEVEKRGNVSIMEIRQTTITEKTQQPILTLKEAKKLGKQNWKPYPLKGKVKFLSCVVPYGDQRIRFIVPDDVYQDLKDK